MQRRILLRSACFCIGTPTASINLAAFARLPLWRAHHSLLATRHSHEIVTDMKLNGTALVPAAREKVWQALTDPAFLARCLPGAQALTPDGPGRYKVSLKMGIAAFSGKFDGSVQLSDEHPPESFRMAVEGRSAPGFLKGQGTITLHDGKPDARHAHKAPAETEVHYDGEAQVGGVIASVGSRMIEAAAKKIIRQFFDAVASQLGSPVKSK